MYTYSKKKERKIISYMKSKAKKIIPSSFCTCNTLFTHMGIIGNINEDNKEDSKDVI